jgi:hypothetical protein
VDLSIPSDRSARPGHLTSCCPCGVTWRPRGSSSPRAVAVGTAPAEVTTDRAPVYPRVLDELVPSALHTVEQYANNPIEADHGRLKARRGSLREIATDLPVVLMAAGRPRRAARSARPAAAPGVDLNRAWVSARSRSAVSACAAGQAADVSPRGVPPTTIPACQATGGPRPGHRYTRLPGKSALGRAECESLVHTKPPTGPALRWGVRACQPASYPRLKLACLYDA